MAFRGRAPSHGIPSAGLLSDTLRKRVRRGVDLRECPSDFRKRLGRFQQHRMMENQRALVSPRRLAQIADLAKALRRAADVGRVESLVQGDALRAKRGHQSL